MAYKKVTQAGQLDRKIDLLQRDTHAGAGGLNKPMGFSYSPYRSGVWANKQDAGGSENEENPGAPRTTAKGRTQFVIRYDAKVEPTMRVKCEGVEYNIVNVREGETRRQWTIIDTERHD